MNEYDLPIELLQYFLRPSEEDFDDVGCIYTLLASRQGAFQGSSNHERSQQLTDPHCFRPLSLD